MTKIIFSGIANKIAKHCVNLLTEAGLSTTESEQYIKPNFESNNGIPVWVASNDLHNLYSSSEEKDDIKFILFFNSPECTLSLLEPEKIDRNDNVFPDWIEITNELLNFYLSNMKNTILVNVASCINKPHSLIDIVNTKFGSKLQHRLSSEELKSKTHEFSLNQLFETKQSVSMNSLFDNDLIQEVYEKIVSAADLVTDIDESTFESRAKLHAEKSVTELATLQHKSVKNTEFESHVSELTSENEIALLQIHQLQEELEFYFIKSQSTAIWKNKSMQVDVTNRRFEKMLKLQNI
ncbi:hypothetical protein RGQ13_14400 [Thalassotalea psychrophila]|uniref:Uncharacterized protein n=1 Tax=Thalassotalea psychrophila TaxID=3065647 RepID=A0ABY9TRG9_9GAMM|nr:hypothetical protein RGQ13_14400 [Colwelliaceae bacterium SQ149]